MADLAHSKLLTAAARDILRPAGLRQKGRSRVWLDDHAWWVGVVEFQPSAWSRGSYLNVGAMWLWHPAPHHIRFDVGHRVDKAGFIEYESDEQFAPLARRFAEMALERVNELRRRLPDLAAATDHLLGEACGSNWPTFDAGVALALSDRRDDATKMFTRITATGDDPDWWLQAVDRAERYAGLLSSESGTRELKREISDAVRAFRRALKLEPGCELPWEKDAGG